MKRLGMMAAVVLLWASSALASGGIWNMKQGDIVSYRKPASTDSVEMRQGITYNTPAGIMQLHAGIYLAGTEMGLPDSIEIRGDGPGKTIIKHVGSTLHRIFSANRKKKIVLRDLTIDGDMANVSTYPTDRWDRVSALDFTDCEDVVLDNVEIRGTRGNAIHGARLIRFRLANSIIHDTDGWGSVISAGADITYESNHLERIWGQGLTVDGYNAGSAWYQGINGSRRVKFLNNTILTVFRNPLHVDEAAGIAYHEGDSTGVFDAIISGNFVKDSEALGYTLNTGERNDGFGDSKTVVVGNTAEGMVLNSGIGMELIGTNFTLSANVLKNNKYGTTVQDARNVSISSGQYISTIGSSQIGVIVSPAGAPDDVQDFTLTGSQFFGGTGFQVAAVNTTRHHSGFNVSGNLFRWCEKPVLVQAIVDKMKVNGNIIDNDTTGVVDGRGILIWGDGVEVAHNYIKCRPALDAISTQSSGASGVVSIFDNQIAQADEGIKLNAACSVLQLGRNYFGAMTTAPYGGLTNATLLYPILLGSAVEGGNGATKPLLYSEKIFDLSAATSGQSSKSVDVVSRFTNTSAFTNLSLNGAHFINQYGSGGSGGGDVATGLAVAGYSEHRGNSAITGALYGGEFASTMYNTGSAVSLFGSLNTAQITSGSTSTVTTLRGMQSLARVAGSGTGTVATAVAVEGVAGMQNTAAGTITDAIAGRFNCIKDGGVTGTITNAYGIKIDTINQGGTNNYGIRITGAAAGASNINRSLSVDAGESFFGGKAIVQDSLRVNLGIRTARNITVDPSGDRVTFTGSGAKLIEATDASSSIRLNAASGTQRLEANSSGVDIAQRLVVADSTRSNKGLYVGGRFIPKIDGNSASLNFGAPGAVPGSVDLTITVNGAAMGNRVLIGAPITIGVNYILTGFVSAANTVTIRWTQIAGAAADPDGAGGTYTADVVQ